MYIWSFPMSDLQSILGRYGKSIVNISRQYASIAVVPILSDRAKVNRNRMEKSILVHNCYTAFFFVFVWLPPTTVSSWHSNMH